MIGVNEKNFGEGNVIPGEISEIGEFEEWGIVPQESKPNSLRSFEIVKTILRDGRFVEEKKEVIVPKARM